MPLFHAYGWDLGFLPTLKLGCDDVPRGGDLARAAIGKLLREHEIDVLPGTPSMYAELSKLPTAKKLEAQVAAVPRGGLAARSGSSPTSSSTSTAIAVLSLLPLDRGRHGRARGHRASTRPRSASRSTASRSRSPAPTASRRAAKEGLIWVKSKTLSPKSIGPFDEERDARRRARPAWSRSARSTSTGWLRTGDLGKLDKTGRLQLTGREDDVVKVDGKRVALGEVEGCLEAFPKIKAAQATVVTDPMAGAMVVARVVTKQKCGAEEIIDHCARNLAPYKVPRRIEFCETI